MNIPEKCFDCNHTIILFENVHKGWSRYQLENVVRCDCFPAHYIVGSVCAEVYCKRNGKEIKK